MLTGACSESAGHTAAWGSRVEQCQVAEVEGDTSKHSATVLYSDRGDEVEVVRVLHWGHAKRWLFILCHDAARCPSAIVGIGDTLHVRHVTRPSPSTVLSGTEAACDIGILQPPARTRLVQV